MFFKLFTQDRIVLEAMIQFLHQRRVLVDYAIPIQEVGGYTQIVRVKCDEKDLRNMLRARFKKNFSITK